MISFKLMVFLLSVIAAAILKTTHAESIDVKSNNATDINKNKENKTIIELNKDITVNTGLNLDKALAQLNGTEASNVPKIRKVTSVDNDSLERKAKSEENAKEIKSVSTKTTANPLQVNTILTEAGRVDIKASAKNVTNNTSGVVKNEKNKATISTKGSANKTDSNLTDNTKVGANVDTNNSSTLTLTTKKSALATGTITTTTATPTVATNGTKANISSTVATSSRPNGNTNSSAPTASSTTTTSTTTTTTKTTTTVTPKPKKPTITYSILDYPDLEKDIPELKNLLQSSASNKLPQPDGPYAQPSQEFNGNFHRGRDFILPIVSMIFIIPLVIGIMITSYRRFRDCWSTRHYRRMDFLVDGMYND